MSVEVPESHRDLLDARFATLATVGPSGYPQVSIVWFSWEDGTFKTSVHTSRQKAKNAARTGKATVTIADPANPYRYLEIRGDATIEPDPGLAFMRRSFVKYGTTPEEFPGEKDDGRQILVLEPVRVRIWPASGH